jgi:hypothetical protein
MKAQFKAGLAGFSGKLDGAVYYYHPKLKRWLMRKQPNMPLQAKNIEYRNVAQRLSALQVSEGYKRDFKRYLAELRDQDAKVLVPSWWSLFVKMMWKMQAAYPDQVDLTQITRAQIESQALPCRSVSLAIEAGLLEAVPGYEKYTDLL